MIPSTQKVNGCNRYHLCSLHVIKFTSLSIVIKAEYASLPKFPFLFSSMTVVTNLQSCFDDEMHVSHLVQCLKHVKCSVFGCDYCYPSSLQVDQGRQVGSNSPNQRLSFYTTLSSQSWAWPEYLKSPLQRRLLHCHHHSFSILHIFLF